MPSSSDAATAVVDFEEFFRANHRLLTRFITARVPDEQTAQDIAADAMLRTFQNLRAADAPGTNPRALLYTIARHGIADFYRERHAHAEIPIEDAPPIAAPGSIPEMVDASADVQAVQEVLPTLHAEYREVITLHAIVGLSITEIADMIGKRPATVRVLLFRARRSLRGALGRGGARSAVENATGTHTDTEKKI